MMELDPSIKADATAFGKALANAGAVQIREGTPLRMDGGKALRDLQDLIQTDGSRRLLGMILMLHVSVRNPDMASYVAELADADGQSMDRHLATILTSARHHDHQLADFLSDALLDRDKTLELASILYSSIEQRVMAFMDAACGTWSAPEQDAIMALADDGSSRRTSRIRLVGGRGRSPDEVGLLDMGGPVRSTESIGAAVALAMWLSGERDSRPFETLEDLAASYGTEDFVDICLRHGTAERIRNDHDVRAFIGNSEENEPTPYPSSRYHFLSAMPATEFAVTWKGLGIHRVDGMSGLTPDGLADVLREIVRTEAQVVILDLSGAVETAQILKVVDMVVALQKVVVFREAPRKMRTALAERIAAPFIDEAWMGTVTETLREHVFLS
jgi:hypothetical protein